MNREGRGAGSLERWLLCRKDIEILCRVRTEVLGWCFWAETGNDLIVVSELVSFIEDIARGYAPQKEGTVTLVSLVPKQKWPVFHVTFDAHCIELSAYYCDCWRLLEKRVGKFVPPDLRRDPHQDFYKILMGEDGDEDDAVIRSTPRREVVTFYTDGGFNAGKFEKWLEKISAASDSEEGCVMISEDKFILTSLA